MNRNTTTEPPRESRGNRLRARESTEAYLSIWEKPGPTYLSLFSSAGHLTGNRCGYIAQRTRPFQSIVCLLCPHAAVGLDNSKGASLSTEKRAHRRTVWSMNASFFRWIRSGCCTSVAIPFGTFRPSGPAKKDTPRDLSSGGPTLYLRTPLPLTILSIVNVDLSLRKHKRHRYGVYSLSIFGAGSLK